MPQLKDLVRLQDVDLAIDKLRAAVEDAESRLGESEELVSARARVEELTAALSAARSAQKDVDLEAETMRGKITPQEEKLYGGTIKNPKELSDIQADVDQMKRHLSAIEDRDLEAIAAVESVQAELDAATAALGDIETAWTATQAQLRETISSARGELGTLEPERAEQASGIEKDILAKYDHIRRVHQGRGVAKLDRNLCLGCRISLPVSAVNRARAGTTIVQCPNCERILYT